MEFQVGKPDNVDMDVSKGILINQKPRPYRANKSAKRLPTSFHTGVVEILRYDVKSLGFHSSFSP